MYDLIGIVNIIRMVSIVIFCTSFGIALGGYIVTSVTSTIEIKLNPTVKKIVLFTITAVTVILGAYYLN